MRQEATTLARIVENESGEEEDTEDDGVDGGVYVFAAVNIGQNRSIGSTLPTYVKIGP